MDQPLFGRKPTGSIIFAACDSKYFIDHAVPFITSSSQAGFNTHVHVINPNEDVHKMAISINKVTENTVTYSFEERDVSPLESEQERAYYACLRFMTLPTLLETADNVLTLDIDCMVMNNFEFPKTPLAYFPRPNETSEEMKVAAGAVFITNDAMNVAVGIAETIGNLPLKWFVDQIALSHIFNQIPAEHVTEFDSGFMDWEFVDGTSIWTGKGPRKYDNKTYLAKKNEFTAEYNRKLQC